MRPVCNAVKTIYYCYYSLSSGAPFCRQDPFDTLEAAQIEASALRSRGGRGTIVRTFEPLYDEVNNSFRDFEVVARF
jgi:hypothetical protein